MNFLQALINKLRKEWSIILAYLYASYRMYTMPQEMPLLHRWGFTIFLGITAVFVVFEHLFDPKTQKILNGLLFVAGCAWLVYVYAVTPEG